MKKPQARRFNIIRLVISIVSISLFCCLIAQEVMISFDTEGKLYLIDSKLGEKLSLFKEYENFQEARLFQLPDSTYTLEIYYRPGNQTVRVKIPLDAKELSDLRNKIMLELTQKSPETALNQEGRLKFIVDAMTLSLIYYGWAMQAALDIDDPKLGVATYMLVSGAGFYLPYSYTANIEVTDAAATLSYYGGTRGILHGQVLAQLLHEEPSDRALFTSGMLTSIAEFIGGFIIANRLNLTTGSSEVIGTTGDFGLLMGYGTAHLLSFFDNENFRGIAACVLFGSGAGYIIGKLMSDHQPYTRGDAYIYKSAGFLGAYIPLAIVDAFEPEEGKVYTVSSMIGGTIGAIMGDYLVRKKDFTAAQGRLVLLSEIAGGLLGLGTAYLISSEDRDNSTLYLASTAIGASAGFWLMYKNFREKAPIEAGIQPLEIGFHPEIFLSTFNRKNKNPVLPGPRTFLSVNFKF